MLKPLGLVLRHSIVNHMEANKLVMGEQYSFGHKRPCLINLLSIVDEVTGRIDGGKKVEVCYPELQTTLDSVNHRLLGQKVDAFWVKQK